MSQYKVPENEKDVYHVRLVREEFDPKTGKPLFQPFVQKYTPHEYAILLRFPGGYKIQEVLHDPTAKQADIQIPPPGKK